LPKFIKTLRLNLRVLFLLTKIINMNL